VTRNVKYGSLAAMQAGGKGGQGEHILNLGLNPTPYIINPSC